MKNRVVKCCLAWTVACSCLIVFACMVLSKTGLKSVLHVMYKHLDMSIQLGFEYNMMGNAWFVDIRLINVICDLFLLYYAILLVCNDSRVCCVCITMYIWTVCWLSDDVEAVQGCQPVSCLSELALLDWHGCRASTGLLLALIDALLRPSNVNKCVV